MNVAEIMQKRQEGRGNSVPAPLRSIPLVHDPDTQSLSLVQPISNRGDREQDPREQNTQEMARITQPIGSERRVKAQQVLEMIKQRRSIGQVTTESPSREQIESLLEAATYAPNHHVNEPWRFFVVTGAAREELGAMMAASLRMNAQDITHEKMQVLTQRERLKPLRAPVIITVTVPAKQDVKDLFIEDVEAAAAATQNMLLMAEAMGLATIWRTGDAAYDPWIKRWFGLTPEDHIVGFIYLGYAKNARAMRTPTPFAEKTIWMC
jgi:nitroreductase